MIDTSSFPLIGPDDEQGEGEVVLAIFTDRHGRLLLQLRDDFPDVSGGGTWSLFGGHIDPGEDLETALIREIEEELGLTLPITDYTPFGWFRGFSRTRPKIYVFQCNRLTEPQQVVLGEGAGFAFLTPAQCGKIERSKVLDPVLATYFKTMRD